MSEELKFEFNDYVIAIDEPYENDYGYVAIGKKQSNGINIVFKSPNKGTVNWFIELQKYITNLQSQLDQAKSEITKYKILLNDMETENSHLETMLDQANERLKSVSVSKFELGQEVFVFDWDEQIRSGRIYEIQTNAVLHDRQPHITYLVDFTGNYSDDDQENDYYEEKDIYATLKEAEKKLQELQNGDFSGE